MGTCVWVVLHPAPKNCDHVNDMVQHKVQYKAAAGIVRRG